MKKLLFILMLAISIHGYSSGPENGNLGKDEMPLNALVSIVDLSLSKVAGSLEGVKVKKASMEYEIEKTTTVEGKVVIFVKVGGSSSSANSSSISYSYTPKGGQQEKALTDKMDLLANKLAAQIVQAAEAYKAAADIIGKNSPNELHKAGFTIKFAFSIEKSGAAGLEFELFGFEAGAGGDHSKSAAHNITIEFENS